MPTPQRAGRPDYREIATIEQGRDITRSYVGPLLRSQDTILLNRGGGNLRAYEEIWRDAQVKSCFQIFQSSVTSREWSVGVGKTRFRAPDEGDRRAADFAREMLESLPWDEITEKMLTAWFYGYGVAEALFARDDGWVTWDDTRGGLRVRKARRFGFGLDKNLRLLTWSDQYQGEPLQAEKFWTISVGADNHDDPHGLGLAHWLYWPVRFAREGLRFWLKFLEVCGVPARLGQYPAGATREEQSRLLKAAGDLGSASAAIIPQGMVLGFLERSGGSSSPDNAELVRLCQEEIAKLILGQTLTTESSGGQYRADVQNGVRVELARAASDRLCHSFCNGPLRVLLGYNADRLGGNPAIPVVSRDFGEPEDNSQKIAAYKQLWEVGWEPTEQRVLEDFGEGFVRRVNLSDPLPGGDTGDPAEGVEGTADFSEPESAYPDQEALDELISSLSPEALQAQGQGLTEAILALVEGATSIEEVYVRLAEVYPDLDDESLEQSLERAIFVAEVWGRLNGAS